MNKVNLILGVFVLLNGCALLQSSSFPEEYGEAKPRSRTVSQLNPGAIDYWSQVKPILDKRCVVCHACTDAPCQTKLTAPEAISRGANTSSPYDTERLLDARPTRLFMDAHSDKEWRGRGFHSIINEYQQSTSINKQASPMHQLLEMKESVPTAAANQRFSDDEFSLQIYRESECPTAENMEKFKQQRPNWGMPYALPILPEQEQQTLKTWLAEGALHTPRKELSPQLQEQVSIWEQFLNGTSNKSRLVNRYLYEHLFLAHLYLDGSEERRFFRLVRSSTPPGEPISLIATRRPFDDPGVKQVYYRLIPEKESITFKNHLPYVLNKKRMKLWQQLFLTTDYQVDSLPGYEAEASANPFITFQQIPANSRYRFLLDEARFTIMNYIKGSVCRGQVALNVIRDQFWVFFVNPDAQDHLLVDQFLESTNSYLAMPSIRTNLTNMPTNWLRYSRKERKLLAARDEFLHQTLGQPGAIDLDLVWDGDGENDNAALTIFRHYDRATIEKGLIGRPPETAWLIDYPLLERIHYLLVAGYDVYGNMSHQVLTRLHMDFLRIEGEANFLLLLPRETRQALRDRWYRDVHEEMVEYVSNSSFESHSEPGINYRTSDPKTELYSLLEGHLANVVETRRDLENSPTDLQKELNRLSLYNGSGAQALPEISYVRVQSKQGGAAYFSLLRNNAQSNVSSLANEKRRILPEETTVTVASGIIGAYPTALLNVPESEFKSFVDQVLALRDSDDFTQIMNLYGIRRTHPNFWALSDELQAAMYKQDPVEGGILDYIRLGNF